MLQNLSFHFPYLIFTSRQIIWTDELRIVTGYGTLFYVYIQDSGEGLKVLTMASWERSLGNGSWMPGSHGNLYVNIE
jgi:hypothetical protein